MLALGLPAFRATRRLARFRLGCITQCVPIRYQPRALDFVLTHFHRRAIHIQCDALTGDFNDAAAQTTPSVTRKFQCDFRFLADESGVVAISDAEVSPGLVEDAYFRNVLPLVMQLRGHEVLHASAVSTPGGLVVLCGVSGAGKSTFASALSARGHRVWADDAVVLKIDSNDAATFRAEAEQIQSLLGC